MTSLNLKMKSSFTMILTILFLFSCETKIESIEKEKSEVLFSFKAKHDKRAKNTTDHIKKVMISLDNNGNPVWTRKELDTRNFNGNIITLPINLTIGNYSITEFMLLDENNNVIFASPKEGSQLANLVSNPLDLEFSVLKDQTKTISPDVISAKNVKPEDFGYTSFGFEIIKTMNISIAVQHYNETTNSLQLTNAILKLGVGTDINFNDEILAETTIIKVQDKPDSIYTITVTKAGYQSYQQTFTKDSLYTHNSDPLIITLYKNKYQSISAKVYNNAVLKSDGTLWMAGFNGQGAIGDGSNINRDTFVQVMSDVIAISAGNFFTYLLKSDGSVWSTGRNGDGQLGDGTNTDRNTFVKVSENASAISAGGQHALVLKNNGDLWATGNNTFGQFGNSLNSSSNSFILVAEGVKEISAGTYHSLILRSGGRFYSTGSNQYGALGDSTNISRNYFRKIMTNVIQISAGSDYSMILKSDQTAWATGINVNGELGDGTNINKNAFTQIMSGVKSIQAGNYHSMLIKTNQSLWITGRGTAGQFGIGTNTSSNNYLEVMQNVSGMATGLYHSFIMKNDGSLWAAGHNSYGQYGNGTVTSQNIFIQIVL